MSATATVGTSLEADAFMRKYLARPADVTARLVFADWLEETCVPHNLAWAYYIRLKVEADRYDPDSRERRELDRQAEEYVPKIRANLTLSATLFVGYPRSLLQLLPAPNITVRLAGFNPGADVLSVFHRDVAELYGFFPLARQRDVGLIAVSGWWDPEDVCDDLSMLHGLHFVAVRASLREVRWAISTRYRSSDGTHTPFSPELV
jgi:uncharacterized protein (TIGR02996 family)